MERVILSMDQGWRFLPEDPPVAKAMGHQPIYMASKTERGRGLAARDYYDAEWEEVTLPHDYQILGDYDTSLEGSHGYLPRYNAWYRRSFFLDEEDLNKRITMIFDGITTNATIWVNGHLMERNFCGYNAIEIDITDVLRPVDEANTVAVRVEANDEDFEGWWYEGAGIYRHVWLQKTSLTAVATWGTFVKPLKEGDRWQVEIETEVVNRSYDQGSCLVEHKILDPVGQGVGRLSQSITLDDKLKITDHQKCLVESPDLWTLETPVLYTVETKVIKDGQLVDIYKTEFGFRTIAFDPDKGFSLNGVATKIKGVCGHQDHGGLGVALPEQVWELRVKKLKAMGCNAYRCGHTPAPTEFLRLCDRYGILVMDECRWFESSRIGQLQLGNMLKKDRNHPCVFIWSVGNEEPEQSTEVGKRIASHQKQFVKTYDDTRPVTVALNGGYDVKKVTEASDIIGINYMF